MASSRNVASTVRNPLSSASAGVSVDDELGGGGDLSLEIAPETAKSINSNPLALSRSMGGPADPLPNQTVEYLLFMEPTDLTMAPPEPAGCAAALKKAICSALFGKVRLPCFAKCAEGGLFLARHCRTSSLTTSPDPPHTSPQTPHRNSTSTDHTRPPNTAPQLHHSNTISTA